MTPPLSASARVRARLKDELQSRAISQRELADALSKQTAEFWTQSRVAKVLGGHVELKLDDVEAIARVAGIALSEAVRDRGLEFWAEMTPTEVRILERLRQRPHIREALLLLLDVHQPSVPDLHPKPKRGRPLNSEVLLRKKP